MMVDIARENAESMERDDRYNVYLGIGYAYVQMRNHTADLGLKNPLIEYPTNKFTRNLLMKL